MPRRRAAALCSALLSVGFLSGCAPLAEVYTLHFEPGPAGGELDAATLLRRQVVPADRLVSLSEAFRRAPEGSIILTCWKDTDITNFWGPCSHITRKYAPGQVMETYNFTRPLAGVYSQTLEYKYYAVIVLDSGVKPEQLAPMWAAAHKLDGSYYNLTGLPGGYYCSTYQNALQHAVGLPDVVPFNAQWNVALPADALKVPGVKVLWVGLNPASPAAYVPGPDDLRAQAGADTGR